MRNNQLDNLFTNNFTPKVEVKEKKPKTVDKKALLKEKVEQLQAMGFTDQRRNMGALEQSKGKIEEAIQLLLNESQPAADNKPDKDLSLD